MIAQFALMAVVVVAGFRPPGWPEEASLVRVAFGLVLVVAGTVFAVWASRELGRALTPFPKPRPTGLVTSGPFAVVRHPIYFGLLGVFAGYGLLTGIGALALTGVLAGLWVGKARVEERLLADVYPDYEAYCDRVRWRIAPFVY
ncbi:isoprenylcysteine carboxylmethyltransferase family protein [Gaiella sp.]|uniref:methyltransferase family protein n=1 Tax=Gaiella sp. TaxID=2663207 RepID=UPI003262ECBA